MLPSNHAEISVCFVNRQAASGTVLNKRQRKDTHTKHGNYE